MDTYLHSYHINPPSAVEEGRVEMAPRQTPAGPPPTGRAAAGESSHPPIAAPGGARLGYPAPEARATGGHDITG